jgi:DNA-binding NarL/FixJ family response regulator
MEATLRAYLWLDFYCSADEQELGRELLRALEARFAGEAAARRLRVAIWLSRGWSNREIAAEHGVTETTIRRDIEALRGVYRPMSHPADSRL